MTRNEWVSTHVCCPKCGSLSIMKSDKDVPDVDDYIDEVNSAKCTACGWNGMVKQLVDDPNRLAGVETLNVAIRTMDKDGDVFISARDTIGSILQFGSVLIANLQDESAKQYTKNILTEIIKMISSTDAHHMKAKLLAQADILEEGASQE